MRPSEPARSLLVLRGAMWVLIGFVLVLRPRNPMLLWLFGTYLILDGVFTLMDTLMSRGTGTEPLWGATALLVGGWLVLSPTVYASPSHLVLGISLFGLGVLQLISLYARRSTPGFASGALLAMLGLAVLARPLFSPLAFTYFIAGALVLTGLVLFGVTAPYLIERSAAPRAAHQSMARTTPSAAKRRR